VRLFEHPDFDQAIIRAAEHFRGHGLRPAMIEKDYYVTEALRIISSTAFDKVIFKGGTSLTKGWNLIQRFSEDIDIFLDPNAYQPALGRNAINREAKILRDAIIAHPALEFVEKESRTFGGVGRSDSFSYDQHFGASGEVINRFLVETGTASGREPTTTVNLQSYLGQFLDETSTSLGTNDERSFPLQLLHFRRTFVEKMFAIHSKVELLKKNKQPIGTYARHYYDLYKLAAQSEVIKMLKSPEYDDIKSDYDIISRAHYPDTYFYPKDMRFSNSEALFPSASLAPILGAEYEKQCQMLCYGPYPPWADVLVRFEELETLL
jgi:predicted nucleotidyltransferase component of viral defense system